MQHKSSNSAALWFIPLVAVVLAVLFVLVFLAGKFLYNEMNKKQGVILSAQTVKSTPPVQTAQARQPVAPVVPFVEADETDEDAPLPPEVEIPAAAAIPPVPEVCPASAVPVKLEKPKRRRPATPFEQGLKQCMAGGTYPCAWNDTSYGLIEQGWAKGSKREEWTYESLLAVVNKQFWVLSADGPIQRGVYDPETGDLINETIATLSGTVTQFTQGNTTWYFEGGVLTKIRTAPYDNCKLYDWFFIDASGKQDVCQCAYNQPDCCARSPYKEGAPHSYCGMSGGVDEFCK